MPAQLIDGKKLAETLQAQIAQEVVTLQKSRGFVPGLAVVLVGDNEASKVYVRNKEAACKKAGMHAEQINLPATTPEAELLKQIDRLNQDPKIHGILVQLPLPKQIDPQKVLGAIAPDKDADGFHPVNVGHLLIGKPSVLPCTPFGVMKMLESTGIALEGKDAVVVGRSNIVGKPVAILLMQKNATVTIAHSKTKDLPEKVRRADIVVAAIGQANFIKGDWIKEGAVVIDVGMNRGPDGKLCGDVEFAKARERAAWITPVPGGVGPMTITMLLWNTLQAAKKNGKVVKFSDFYQTGRVSYSFEVFPPKTDEGVVNLIAALNRLAVFQPAFVSVTYGAMGTTRDLTRDLALRVLHETKLVTAFHFTCVGAARSAVKAYVERLKKEGISLIVALRGDAPQGGERPESDFSYANELVAYLKEIDGFSIAVAGYPEGHLEAPDRETDLRNLKRKVDAGADVVLTQLFFDNQDYFDFVGRARKIGITVPLVPGIMPILNLKQIEKITTMCGAKLPDELHRNLEKAQGDPEAMRKVGVDHAVRQCRELVARGVPGIHFYVLNRSESTSEVLKALA